MARVQLGESRLKARRLRRRVVMSIFVLSLLLVFVGGWWRCPGPRLCASLQCRSVGCEQQIKKRLSKRCGKSLQAATCTYLLSRIFFVSATNNCRKTAEFFYYKNSDCAGRRLPHYFGWGCRETPRCLVVR